MAFGGHYCLSRDLGLLRHDLAIGDLQLPLLAPPLYGVLFQRHLVAKTVLRRVKLLFLALPLLLAEQILILILTPNLDLSKSPDNTLFKFHMKTLKLHLIVEFLIAIRFIMSEFVCTCWYSFFLKFSFLSK